MEVFMNEDNIIVQKSKSFSLKIITLYKFLVDEKKNMFFQSKY